MEKIAGKQTRAVWLMPVVALLLMAALCLPAAAAIVFQNGCDNSADWTGAGGATTMPTFQTTTKHSAPGAVKWTNTSNRCYKTFTATSTNPIVMRFWLYDDTAQNDDANSMDMRDSSANTLYAAGVNSGAGYSYYGMRVKNGATSNWYAGSVARATGWHRMEVYRDSSGNANLYVDSTLAKAATGGATGPVDRVYLGVGTGTTAVTANQCMDTIAILGAPRRITINTPVGGTISGTVGGVTFSPLTGYYDDSETISLTATDGTYAFSKWTDQSGNTLSTDRTYDFSLSANPSVTEVKAVFAVQDYLLTVIANTGGTVTSTPASGTRVVGTTSVKVTAIPDPGKYFVSWSSDAAGLNVVSTKGTYTFAMPTNDVTLYANFADRTRILWTDGFESRAAGSLDSNHSGGANASANGTGANPWFGADPTDVSITAAVNGVTPHGGTKMGWSAVGTYNCETMTNLGYRLNNDSPVWGDCFLDWWFYDPNGTNIGNNYRDYVALCTYPRNPILGAVGANQDYNLTSGTYTSNKNFERFSQQMLAIGAMGWRDGTVTWDTTKYQIRVQGDTASTYANGWSDTSVTRTVGWHRARIVVGPRKAGGTNDVSFFIDDMVNPVAVKDSTTTVGYNAVGMWMSPDTTPTTGYLDDFAFGTVPAALNLVLTPTSGVVTSTTATWEGIGAASYQLKVDNGSWQTATSPFIVDASGLTYGNHTVTVRALDALGNDGATTSATFAVDRSSIRSWNACGFYPSGDSVAAGSPRYGIDYFAPDGAEATMGSLTGLPAYNGKSWISYTSATPTIDFDKIWGANKTYGVSYLFTYIYNTGSAINAYLTGGSDDGLKVWVNGSLVLGHDVYRGLVIDADMSDGGAVPYTGTPTPFVINPGWNRLLVKETQGTGSESAQIRLCNSDKSEPAWLSQLTFPLTDISGSISGPASSASATVTLNVSATDHLSGVAKMAFSNDNVNWSTPEPFAATKVWSLAPGAAGMRTCYARFTDNAGNVGAVCSTTVNVTAANNALTLTSVPDGAAVLTGSGTYPQGTVIPISAVAKPGYTFSKWTSDQAGTQLVSSNASFSYTMPSTAKTLYAQFTTNIYSLTTIAKPATGGAVTGDHGNKPYNTACSVIATPNPGYKFVSWTTNPDRTGVVSTSATYAFNMPANNLTLYANFDQYLFRETFEGLNIGSIDSNDSGGTNQAANGNLAGNPWWGTAPGNGAVGVEGTYPAHRGTKALWSNFAGNGRDYVNIAYRVNGGQALFDNIYLDWWFYDPSGQAWDLISANYCDDTLVLGYSSVIGQAGDGKDYPESANTKNFGDTDFEQKLALGMCDWWTSTGYDHLSNGPYPIYPGFDHTKYQARIKSGAMNDAIDFGNGWYNTNVSRSVGWHHARITVGPLTEYWTTDVQFFLDDMSVPQLTGYAVANGFNAIELTTEWKNGKSGSAADTAVLNWPKGAMYDDIVLGTMPQPVPVSPVAGAASNITVNSIQWNWTEADPADGFHVFDAATLGAQKGDTAVNSLNETGLNANTVYSRWVSAYYSPVPPDVTFDSLRTALAAATTLALKPTYGTTGDGTVSCSLGSTGSVMLGTSAVFTATNDFGAGKSKAASYVYIWNTTAGEPGSWASATPWTSGSLTLTPSSVGSYYLHLRALNTAGAVNTDSATFGPYEFTNPATPVAKISDLWPLANGPVYSLSDKVVTGVVGSSFWIEETNRSSAIKVVYTGTMPVKDHKVDVTGVLSSASGERVLNASAWTDKGAATPIQPLAVVERAAGGKGVNANTPAISGGVGLYNVAMLVRIAGSVTNYNTSDPNNKYFYLDDGSGLVDGAQSGIKVLCGSNTPPTSGDKTVTGLVGVVGGKPVLIIRTLDDVKDSAQ